MKGLVYHEILHTEDKDLLTNVIASAAVIEEWSCKHTEIDKNRQAWFCINDLKGHVEQHFM